MKELRIDCAKPPCNQCLISKMKVRSLRHFLQLEYKCGSCDKRRKKEKQND